MQQIVRSGELSYRYNRLPGELKPGSFEGQNTNGSIQLWLKSFEDLERLNQSTPCLMKSAHGTKGLLM